MKIASLSIQGYKRLRIATCNFGDATFLIGPNNSGKSTVLGAITHLLSANKRIPAEEYYSENDPETHERKTIAQVIVLTAEFRDVPPEAKNWRGFKGRVFEYDAKDSGESGLSITYRKTYELGKDVTVEIMSKPRVPKSGLERATTPRSLIELGVPEDAVIAKFPELDKKLTAAQKTNLAEFDELYDVQDETESTWFQNPGGIPGVVLSRLPRYIIIPAELSSDEICGNGVLSKTLTELFEDVRADSANYREAQRYLDLLARELDPRDGNSEFGKMMNELNQVISNVFPESRIHASADLSDPDKSLKPTFKVELSSNIRTAVDHQGAGMIRSAVFGILRFREHWLASREDKEVTRSIVIGFEEPEIFLHPSAANQMRDTIYELSSGKSQIVATTHSPYLIDISRRPRQILNRFSQTDGTITTESFNVTEKFLALQGTDQDYVKMLLKVDDYIARVFFTRRIVIVEGDTEDIVLRETLQRLEKSRRLTVYAETEIIKARGKAAIVGLAKYLKSFGMHPFVIHDRDQGVPGAEKFNEPIKRLVGEQNVIQLEECIEDVLGYEAPSREKPSTAYDCTKAWGDKWEDVPAKWRAVVEQAFKIN
jgi:predicted ATPase